MMEFRLNVFTICMCGWPQPKGEMCTSFYHLNCQITVTNIFTILCHKKIILNSIKTVMNKSEIGWNSKHIYFERNISIIGVV